MQLYIVAVCRDEYAVSTHKGLHGHSEVDDSQILKPSDVEFPQLPSGSWTRQVQSNTNSSIVLHTRGERGDAEMG